LIVTHSVVIKVLLAYFKGLNIEQLWNPPYIHDTSLSIVEIGNGTKRLVLEGDTGHLSSKKT
jgi:broad specificity phosphatase PhoE